MFIGTLKFELFIPGSSSLKDKRKVVRSIQDRVKAKFNIAIAELAYQDKWQRTVVGMCTINSRKSEIELTMARIKDIFNDNCDFMILNEKNSILVVKDD